MHAAATAGGAGLDVQKLPDLSSGKRVTLSSLGFLVYFILLGSGTTMQLVLAERRDRTYMRIRTAPVRGLNYIEGHGLASFFIIVAQVVAALIIMKFAFRIETFVPDLLLFLILLLFGLAAIGVSMAITAFSRSSQVATILINLILTPSSMVAGCFWPASIMPPFLQRIALFLPQRWVLDAIQKAQTGAAVGALGLDLLVIAGFAVALFLLAGYRFARIEEQGQFV
jgi:ABC-2 type transport system permease protein